MDEIDVIAPNLKRRLSGVTSTIARLVPVQAGMIGIRATGPGLPADVPHLPVWRVAFAPRTRWRVWHARRNTEMALGLILRHVLRRRYRLLFTSASQRVHTGFTRALIRRMDGLVAVSERSAAYLERPADIVVHGVDTELFRPARDRAALRRALGLPDGLVICVPGRVRRQKGQDLVVDAALRLLPDRPDVHIVFLGRAVAEHERFQAEQEARLAQAGLADRVRFAGEVPLAEVARHNQAADLVIAPQRWEGFGLTPLEAMACGTPVLACRDVGTFDLQIADGETGLLVRPDDPEAMTEGLRRLLDVPAELARMRPACRQRVLDRFTLEGEARALVAIYRRLLDGA